MFLTSPVYNTNIDFCFECVIQHTPDIMRFFTSILALAGVQSAVSAATQNLNLSLPPPQSLVFNYLLYLAQAEYALFHGGITQFTNESYTSAGFPADTYGHLVELEAIASQQETILSDLVKCTLILQAALSLAKRLLIRGHTAVGGTPIQSCTYAFQVIANAAELVSTAAIVENVASSAYIGASHLILDRQKQTTVAQLAATKARAASYLFESEGQAPFPQAYDVPITLNEGFTLASPFVISCPAGSNLPLTNYPGLNLAPNQTFPVTAGEVISVVSDNEHLPTKGLKAAWFTFQGYKFVDAHAVNTTVSFPVPSGVLGRVYVVLVPEEKVTDWNILSGPDIIPVVTAM